MVTSTIDPTPPRAFDPEMESAVGTSTQTPGWNLAVERRLDDGRSLAGAIGWFSVALGVTELVAAERLCRYLGMEEKTQLIRLFGLREVAKGVGILNDPTPTGWMWARVAGDVLDLATLATGLTRDNRHRDRVMGAIFAVAGVTVLDVICARQLSETEHHPIQH